MEELAVFENSPKRSHFRRNEMRLLVQFSNQKKGLKRFQLLLNLPN